MALTAPIRDRLALLSFFPAWLKEAETRKAQSSGRALKHNKKKTAATPRERVRGKQNVTSQQSYQAGSVTRKSRANNENKVSAAER